MASLTELDNSSSLLAQAMAVNWSGELSQMENTLTVLKDNLSNFYFCCFAIMTIVMQIGFAMMELGLVRTKSALDVLLKSSIDCMIGAVAFWLIGYALAWGDGNGFIGWTHFALAYIDAKDIGNAFYHLIFANTASIIVTGSLADRLNLKSYFVYAVILSGFSYPVVSRWGWHPDGWLKTMGFHDYGGSGVVFLFAGVSAAVACKIIGSRIGRFDGKINGGQVIPGHSLTMVGLGFLLSMLGFLSYNAANQMSVIRLNDGPTISYASYNTLIACSGGALTALLVNRFLPYWGNYWSYVTMCNGGICGMVAGCAGCDKLMPWGAGLTGVCAGIAFIAVRALVERLTMDDPIDAISVHVGGGLVGLLTCPFLMSDGIFMQPDHRSGQVFGANVLGTLVIVLWALLCTVPLFMLLDRFNLLRVPVDMEVNGIDLPQSNEQAYPPSAWCDNNQESIFSPASPSAHPPTQQSTATDSTDDSAVSRRRRPAPRLSAQSASLSSQNLISSSVELALERIRE